MGTISDLYGKGFANQTYGQWFLFTLLFVAFWWIAISANAMLRGTVARV